VEPLVFIPPGLEPAYSLMSSPEGAEEIFSDDRGVTELDEAPAQHHEYDFLGLLTTPPEQSEFIQQLDASFETLQAPV
jgi:hypothetical protein